MLLIYAHTTLEHFVTILTISFNVSLNILRLTLQTEPGLLSVRQHYVFL